MDTRNKQHRWLLHLLGAAILLLGLAACGSSEDSVDEPNKPKPEVPVDDGDWQTVPATGGTIEKGDITITFPSGTFDSDTKVAVTEVRKGSVLGEADASTFYQLTLPPKINKSYKVTLQSNEQGDDVCVVAHTLGLRLSENEYNYTDILLEPTLSNGAYTVTLPPTSNDDFEDNETLAVNIGLAHMSYWGKNGGSKVRPTRAPVFDETFTEGNVSWHFSFPSYFKIRYGEALALHWDEINDVVREAIKKLHDLGLKVTKRNITMTFSSTIGDAFGTFTQSEYCNEWSTVEFHTKILDNFEGSIEGQNCREEFRSSAIHELMHIFQADYDPRCAYRKADKIGSLTSKISEDWAIHDGSERLMLYESGAVWAEQFMRGSFSRNFAHKYIKGFIKGFYDVGEIYEGSTDETNKHKAYESHGYGMSSLMQYLTRKMTKYKMDDNSVLKLYTIWNKTNKWTKDCIQELTSTAGYDLMALDHYDDFLLSLLEGELIKDEDIMGMEAPNYGQLNDKNLTVIAEGKCYAHGCQINTFSFNISDDIALDTKQLVVDQKEEGVHTYLYFASKGKTEKQGYKAWKDSPTIVEGADIKKEFHNSDLKKTSFTIYTVTMSDYNRKTEPYKVELSLKEAVSVSPDSLGFGASGGTQSTFINYGTYKYYGAKVRSEGNGWCGVEAPKGSPGEIKVTVLANTTGKKRECVIDCYVAEEADATEKEWVKMPVKITQQADSKSRYKISLVDLYTSIKCNITEILSNGQKGEISLLGGFRMFSYIQGDNCEMTEDDTGIHISGSYEDTDDEGVKTEYSLSLTIGNLDGFEGGSTTVSNLKATHKVTSKNTVETHELSVSGVIPMSGKPDDYHNGAFSAAFELRGDQVNGAEVKYTKNYKNGTVLQKDARIVSDPENSINVSLMVWKQEE